MRVIHFPAGGSTNANADDEWVADLEAALHGDALGAAADSWRELRDDVRALAPPIDPGFELRLRERLAQRPPARRARVAARLRPRPSWRPAGAAVAMACTLILVVVLVASWRSSSGGVGTPASAPPKSAVAAPAVTPAVSAGSAGQAIAPTPGGVASTTSGRVQQLAASLSLSTSPESVQATADGVARVTVHDEGFVQSSDVQVRQGAQSEATLLLRLPSARLGAALTALARLAPVRAQSQSLQDITASFDAARRRLADATVERRALLRALAAATTEAKIQALRAQLSQVRGAIARAHSEVQAVSRRASTVEVEVTVMGDAHPASEGLTLHRGLHDAGRVLLVSLTVLMLTAAVLLPLALLLAVLVGGSRIWRRGRRERVLSGP
jgi:Domain of unknown function (DUF4349)